MSYLDVSVTSLCSLLRTEDTVHIISRFENGDVAFYMQGANTEIVTNSIEIDTNAFFKVLKWFYISKIENINGEYYVYVNPPKFGDLLKMHSISFYGHFFKVEMYSSGPEERRYNDTFAGSFEDVKNHFSEITCYHYFRLVQYDFKHNAYCLKFYVTRDANEYVS